MHKVRFFKIIAAIITFYPNFLRNLLDENLGYYFWIMFHLYKYFKPVLKCVGQMKLINHLFNSTM